jgi:hypothetical protein
VSGLSQHYYVRDTRTGRYGGIYIWDSADSLRAFRETALARGIPNVYQVREPPRAETFETVLMPRE